MTDQTGPILEVKNLSKVFHGFTAVKDVSFQVKAGDVFGFLGPNGAGKSTTLRMILGLIVPTGGSIYLFGTDLRSKPDALRKRIGAIVEKPDLFNYLSARDNLSILGRLSGMHVEGRQLDAALDRVGLLHRGKDRVGTYSQGMKQRLGIAQALLHEPDLVILDEPTNGLDPQGMVEVRELIRSLSREQGKTVVLSSHILNEVELLANRMVIIDQGVVAAEGLVTDLLNRNDMRVTVSTDQPARAWELLQQSGYDLRRAQLHSTSLELQLSQEQIPAVCTLLSTNGLRIYALSPVRSLEAYFLSLT